MFFFSLLVNFLFCQNLFFALDLSRSQTSLLPPTPGPATHSHPFSSTMSLQYEELKKHPCRAGPCRLFVHSTAALAGIGALVCRLQLSSVSLNMSHQLASSLRTHSFLLPHALALTLAIFLRYVCLSVCRVASSLSLSLFFFTDSSPPWRPPISLASSSRFCLLSPQLTASLITLAIWRYQLPEIHSRAGSLLLLWRHRVQRAVLMDVATPNWLYSLADKLVHVILDSSRSFLHGNSCIYIDRCKLAGTHVILSKANIYVFIIGISLPCKQKSILAMTISFIFFKYEGIHSLYLYWKR